MSKQINVAIIGVGNCAKSLVEGVALSHRAPLQGLGFEEISGYAPTDIRFVLAYDIDARKIGQPLADAIYAKPNCAMDLGVTTDDIVNVCTTDVNVVCGPALDGVGAHMVDGSYPDDESFALSSSAYVTEDDELSQRQKAFIQHLKETDVDVVLNYLPVGSAEATRFYLDACIEAKVPFVNCIPEFIVSDPEYQQKLIKAGIPAIGDDMRSQIGASIVSAVLQELFIKRGGTIDVHYQDNVGGNTDFLNMQDQSRLASKKISKENVISKQNEIAGLETKPNSLAAGPAKYFPALGDNKRASWLIKGTIFGGAPFEFTADLSCQDSPNSAGVVIDAIRYVMAAKDLNIVGPLIGPSAWTQKTPRIDMRPGDAYKECEMLASGKLPSGYVNISDEPGVRRNAKYVHKDLL